MSGAGQRISRNDRAIAVRDADAMKGSRDVVIDDNGVGAPGIDDNSCNWSSFDRIGIDMAFNTLPT